MLNNSSTFIFIILLSLTSSNIVLIPFKILNKNSINSLTNTSDPFTYIKNEIDKTLYSELYIGDPPHKMTVIITFNSEELEMHHQISKNLFTDTFYDRNKSRTFKKLDIKGENNTNPTKQYFKEQIQLYTDFNFKNLITINDLTFSLFEPSKSEIDEKSLCFNIGLKLTENIENIPDINTNLILQLKQKRIISSYSFNFHYDKINIDGSLYDGYIVIGNEPHQYLKNSYNEFQLYKTKACRRDKQPSWDIYFNKIYFKVNTKEYILDNGVEYFNQASLTPNWGTIEGTVTYERNIRNHFFNRLIKDRKCTRINKDYNIYYYCDKNKISIEELKSFPPLYFSSIELNYVFELNYKDLFFENGDFIYFLVVFYDYPNEITNYFDEYNSRWDLGMPFLKKYFFTFDYDNKYIGFYNNKTVVPDNNPVIITKDKNKENKNYFWIIFVILIFFGIFLAYFLVKKYFRKMKKISAIELESDNINVNTKYSKYYNVEMGQKNLLVEE